MNKVLLTDTGFWLGLLDPTDGYHERANIIADFLPDNRILVPWPCLYEVICTRLTRRREQLLAFEKLLADPSSELLDDSQYKDAALRRTFEMNRTAGYSHSLVDAVVREIVLDDTIRLDYLITFNERDFADVCAKRRIDIFQ